MPRRLVAKVRFLRTYQRLSEADQQLVDLALRQFQRYLQTGEAPVGLGVKRLGGRTYEFRVSLALRVVYVVEGELVVLCLLGSHEEDRRLLKRQ
jgi:hypothetical protein